MFYGVNLDIPLSTHIDNQAAWLTSPLSKLKPGSNLEMLNAHRHWAAFQNVQFAWRVVGAWYPNEDSTMTQFRAYGLNGEHLPFATFGVNHSGVGQISLSEFRHQPWMGKNYYVPRDNQIHTPDSGGYWVEVLDTEYPSEAMKFGQDKSGPGHRCLVISFRLMPFSWERYPNDVPGVSNW